MKNKIFITILTLLVIMILGTTLFKIVNLEKKSENVVISTFNNPKIPKGFKPIDTQEAKWEKNKDGTIKDWNKGLVIEDEIGNQFVWIPIDINNLKYDNQCKKIEDKFMYNAEKLDMNNKDDVQVAKYGGFYLSRYEAGVSDTMQKEMHKISSEKNDINASPVSMKDRLPWNYISFKNAKCNAQNMYSTAEFTSDLPTLKQIQFVMKWLNESGYDVYEDSSKIGNYSNVNFIFTGFYSENHGKDYQYGENILKTGENMILSSGASDRNMTNNIYDIAGNLWEYTDNYFQIDENRILGYYCTGGHFDNSGNHYPAFSYNLKNVTPLDKVGFRIALFFN